ncbi:MAG: hypothetical protein IPP88_20795 [Betaproteobacteria bacterium]|nr:hypothetical protein [Betaproteobacteria bacterium]
MHIWVFAKWIAAIAAIFLGVSYLGNLARQIVGHSGFRLALAANGASSFAGKKLHIAIGNSQFMDGLSADLINKKRRDIKFLNLAFNDLRSTDLLAIMETFYRGCGCTVERLYINAGSLEDEKDGTLDVQIFMSAFNRELLPQFLGDQPALRWSLAALPLLHFNNEVFHRSFYYWLLRRDDQGHGNAYKFRLPKVAPNRLGGTQKKVMIDFPRLARMIEVTRENRTELIVVVPPFHPVYVANRFGFAEYVKQFERELAPYNVPLMDHSTGVVTSYDGFSDLVHMNFDGQKVYSDYFSARVIPE